MLFTTIVLFLLLALDRLGKVVLAGWLEGRGMVELIPGVIGLELLHGGNTGAAFGLLRGRTGILIVITTIVLAAMLYILYTKKLHSRLMYWALLLITAGGIGNLYDRVVYGQVTDFIEFLFFQFPVFNIADCLVCIGAGLAILSVMIAPKNAPIFVAKMRNEQDGPDADA